MVFLSQDKATLSRVEVKKWMHVDLEEGMRNPYAARAIAREHVLSCQPWGFQLSELATITSSEHLSRQLEMRSQEHRLAGPIHIWQVTINGEMHDNFHYQHSEIIIVLVWVLNIEPSVTEQLHPHTKPSLQLHVLISNGGAFIMWNVLILSWIKPWDGLVGPCRGLRIVTFPTHFNFMWREWSLKCNCIYWRE